MLDGFVAAVTAPMVFEPDGDHVMVTLTSGKRQMAINMSVNDLLSTIANARSFIRAWDGGNCEVVQLGKRG